MLSKSAALSKDKRTSKYADATVLQHRHFAVIAGIIAKLDECDRTNVAMHFARELADTNPNFNKTRFMDACVGK